MKPIWILAIACGLLVMAAGAAAAQRIDVIKPEIKLESLQVFPHEGSANKLSAVYTYPNVKNIDVLLRFEVSGLSTEQKAVAFLAMAANGVTLAKHKEKLMVLSGRYEITVPEMLDLSRVFGEKEVTLSLELAVTGAGSVREEKSFRVKGRDLPKVEVLDYLLMPGRYSGYNEFTPGETADGEIVYKLTDAQEADIEIRILGVVDDESSFTIDPRDDYQRYDAYWDLMDGPRRDGIYMLDFEAYLPRYFYRSGAVRHDFTIYVVFLAEGQIIRLIGRQETIVDYRPGTGREADDELMRVLQISRSSSWRQRQLRKYAPYEEHSRWFDETPQP
jgi:hypothetical protein